METYFNMSLVSLLFGCHVELQCRLYTIFLCFVVLVKQKRRETEKTTKKNAYILMVFPIKHEVKFGWLSGLQFVLIVLLSTPFLLPALGFSTLSFLFHVALSYCLQLLFIYALLFSPFLVFAYFSILMSSPQFLSFSCY